MKQFIPIVIIILFCVLACAPAPEKPKNPKQAKNGSQTSKPLARENSEGKALFKKYCMLCHGADGKRGTNGAYDLTVSKLTFNQKVEIVKKGRGVMTPFDFLGEAKIKKVVEYLESLE